MQRRILGRPGVKGEVPYVIFWSKSCKRKSGWVWYLTNMDSPVTSQETSDPGSEQVTHVAWQDARRKPGYLPKSIRRFTCLDSAEALRHSNIIWYGLRDWYKDVAETHGWKMIPTRPHCPQKRVPQVHFVSHTLVTFSNWNRALCGVSAKTHFCAKILQVCSVVFTLVTRGWFFDVSVKISHWSQWWNFWRQPQKRPRVTQCEKPFCYVSSEVISTQRGILFLSWLWGGKMTKQSTGTLLSADFVCVYAAKSLRK